MVWSGGRYSRFDGRHERMVGGSGDSHRLWDGLYDHGAGDENGGAAGRGQLKRRLFPNRGDEKGWKRGAIVEG